MYQKCQFKIIYNLFLCLKMVFLKFSDKLQTRKNNTEIFQPYNLTECSLFRKDLKFWEMYVSEIINK